LAILISFGITIGFALDVIEKDFEAALIALCRNEVKCNLDVLGINVWVMDDVNRKQRMLSVFVLVSTLES
jgi:hypothetical protein